MRYFQKKRENKEESDERSRRWRRHTPDAGSEQTITFLLPGLQIVAWYNLRPHFEWLSHLEKKKAWQAPEGPSGRQLDCRNVSIRFVVYLASLDASSEDASAGAKLKKIESGFVGASCSRRRSYAQGTQYMARDSLVPA